MILQILLPAAGIVQIALALLHLAFPARFRWREEAARMSRLNEQIFHVHTFFVCVTLTLFGVWTLWPGSLPRVVYAGIALFWFLRLLAQLFVYDSALWKGRPFETAVHIAFLFLWTSLTAVYAFAAAAI